MANENQIAISIPATGEEEWQACREPLMSGWLTQGPQVERFESEFSAYVGTAHAVAASSGTTALHLILAAMGVGPGDEVIVPAFTWVATANVVLYCGATPVFVDVDPATFNLDSGQLAGKVTPRTRAIIAVHLFGLCADVDAIMEAAPGIPVIEDAACAVGSVYKGKAAGTLGLAAAFSFHPRKTVTTGEGGMVTTRDAELARRMRVLRSHGASLVESDCPPPPYRMPEFNLLGFNYRLTDLQAAVGRVQLRKLDQWLEERRRWAGLYSAALATIPWLQVPAVSAHGVHSWQSYVCRVDESRAPLKRDALMDYLKTQGIATRPGTHAVHMLGYYRATFGMQPEDFPAACACDRFSMAIPLHNRMTEPEYLRVIDSLIQVADRNA